MVEMVPVESSNVKAVGHDPASSELHVEFKGGARYVYHGVAADKHAALMAAPSVGGHLHAHIKPHHRVTRT